MILNRNSCDPQFDYAARWSYVVFLAGASSLFIDFFFLYVPSVGSRNSLSMDWTTGSHVAISRSMADLIALLGMIINFYTRQISPKYHALGTYQTAKEPKNTKSLFILNLIAVLPIPQVIIGLKDPEWVHLFWVVLGQIPFRALALSPYSKRAVRMTGMHFINNAWSGAFQNLSFFILTSHALGAYFYVTYISKLQYCRNAFAQESNAAALEWDDLINWCTEKYDFEYGIYSDAFITKIGTRSFIQKYTYCLAWGLKSFSSFGQIFSPSSNSTDTALTFFIIIFGLILFGDLLARMQTGLQCTEQREDKQRVRQRMVEEWMKYHQLPQPLKKQVQQAIQSEWSATGGINDEIMLDSLPWDVRSEIRRSLYLDVVHTMPLFAGMDEDLVTAICGYLRVFSKPEGAYVAFEGEPVRQMLFVFSGQLEVSTANNNVPCTALGPGDLCGKELLEWCSQPTTSTENLKPATQTIKCITNVDAFALRIDDVKLLIIQFHRDGKFRRAFHQYTT